MLNSFDIDGVIFMDKYVKNSYLYITLERFWREGKLEKLAFNFIPTCRCSSVGRAADL